MAANNTSNGRTTLSTPSTSAKKARQRQPRCEFCLQRKNDSVTSWQGATRESTMPPSSAATPTTPATPSAAAALLASYTRTEKSIATTCDDCRRLRTRDWIEKALDRWDLFPTTTSSPSSSSSSILINTRPSEEEPLKRQRLTAVPIGKLPMGMPARNNAARVASSWSFLRPTSVAAAARAREDARQKRNERRKKKKTRQIATGGGSEGRVSDIRGGTAVAAVDASNKKSPNDEGASLIAGREEARGSTVLDSSKKEAPNAREIKVIAQHCAVSIEGDGTQITKNRGGGQSTAVAIDSNTTTNKRKRNVANNLLGATVQIKKGKFAGFSGKIIERQSIRRIMIDSVPQRAFDVHDVTIVQHANSYWASAVEGPSASKDAGEEESNEELAARFQGSLVRVTTKPQGGVVPKNGYEGTMGRVVRVIAGDWYITDNSNIANAFQAHKFHVLEYASDNDAVAADGVTAGAGSRRIGYQVEGTRQVAAESVGVRARVSDSKGMGVETKNAMEENKSGLPEKIEKKVHLDATQQKKIHAEKAGSNVGGDNQKAPKDGASAKTVTKAVARRDMPSPLLGATIRIKKGRYAGRTGIIKEKQSIRRLQLDNVVPPVEFADVAIVEPGPSGSLAAVREGGDFAEFATRAKRRYLGAKVRLLHPDPEKHGAVKEGRVIKVIVLGDWYILDDLEITTAFPVHKFDVLKYAGPPEVIDLSIAPEDDSGEEVENEKKGEESVVSIARKTGKNDGCTTTGADHLPPTLPAADDLKEYGRNNDDLNKGTVGKESTREPPTINPSITRDTPHPQYSRVAGQKMTVGAQGGNVGKEGSKEASKEDNARIHVPPIKQSPSSGNQSKYVDKENDVGREDSNKENLEEDKSTSDLLHPELPSHDYQNNCTGERDVKVNEVLTECSKQDTAARAAYEVVTEVCSVKLPSAENIELAARLSAFDSFLFLADNVDGPTARNDNKTAQLTPLGAIDGNFLRSVKGDESNDSHARVKGTVASPALNNVASVTTKPAEPNELSLTDSNSSDTISSSSRANDDKAAIYKVILQLIQQKQKSSQWPAVQVLPGMEVLAERELKQPPLRAIPLEERIVRTIPGGSEEKRDLSRRLGAFDDFLFLIDGK